jgi:hypothetical protein
MYRYDWNDSKTNCTASVDEKRAWKSEFSKFSKWVLLLFWYYPTCAYLVSLWYSDWCILYICGDISSNYKEKRQGSIWMTIQYIE